MALKTFRGKKWGDIALEPCIIYTTPQFCRSISKFLAKKARVKVKGYRAYNRWRAFRECSAYVLSKKNLGVLFDRLPPLRRQWRNYGESARFRITKLMKLGTWGVGMVLIAENTKKALKLLQKSGLKAEVVGRVTDTPNVIIASPITNKN